MCTALNRNNNMTQRDLGKDIEYKDYLLIYSLDYRNTKQ